MPELKEVMAADGDKFEENKRRVRSPKKQRRRPVTPGGVVRLFNHELTQKGYGHPPLVTKKLRHLVSGFIKVSKSNDKEDEWIYETVLKLVRLWPELSRRDDITTLKGKPLKMREIPSLSDFLVCRDSLLSAIEEIEGRIPEQEHESADWMKKVTQSDLDGLL